IQTATPEITPPINPPKKCGDGTCAGPENTSNCPSDCSPINPTRIALAGPELFPGERPNTYWLTNPTSGAQLYVEVLHPTNWDGTPAQTLVLIPGGVGFGTQMAGSGQAQALADRGFAIIVFDPDGRGLSQGDEDYNGFIHQDGLAALLQIIPSLPEVNPEKIGLVSYSYGVTMASGTLSRYPDLQVRFWIDWEGPVNRYYTTGNCNQEFGHIDWQPCTDEVFWAEREALTFISGVKVPYQRIQSQTDHVQPNNNHAIEMINAAVAAGLSWVRLNGYPPNQTYSLDTQPAMLDDQSDKQLNVIITDYANELFNLP
ncbi:MAG TPA: hypothetical protein VFF78_00320, partial [Anaerolineaceae bacterium]|nr:hypothetical protein [Anaerolineaceae bacterium]